MTRGEARSDIGIGSPGSASADGATRAPYPKDHPIHLLDDVRYAAIYSSMERAARGAVDVAELIAECCRNFADAEAVLDTNAAVVATLKRQTSEYTRAITQLEDLRPFVGERAYKSGRAHATVRYFNKLAYTSNFHDADYAESVAQTKPLASLRVLWEERFVETGLRRRKAIECIRDIFYAVHLRGEDPSTALAEVTRQTQVLAQIAEIVDRKQALLNPEQVRRSSRVASWWRDAVKDKGTKISRAEWEDSRYAPFRSIATLPREVPGDAMKLANLRTHLYRVLDALTAAYHTAEAERLRLKKLVIDVNSEAVRSAQRRAKSKA